MGSMGKSPTLVFDYRHSLHIYYIGLNSQLATNSFGISGNLFSFCKCADPESFVRGGPTLTAFFSVDEGREYPNTTKSGAIIGPVAKYNLNGVSLAGR